MKKLLIAGVGVALTAATAASFADGLTLTGNGISNNIAVQCNSIWSGKNYDVPQNGSLGPLPWWLLVGMFGGSPTLKCNFALDNGAYPPSLPANLLGSAKMTINVAQGTAIVNQVVYNKGYTVNIVPGLGIAAKSISVTLNKSK